MNRTRISSSMSTLIAGLLLTSIVHAQPGSALGGGTMNNAPGSSLQRAATPTSAFGQAQPAGAPGAMQMPGALQKAGAPSALQQTNLPADLARMNDNAILTIGGQPMTVAAVKRQLLALDDKALITIGGKQVAIGTIKKHLQGATAAGNTLTQSSAAPNVAAATQRQSPITTTAQTTAAAAGPVKPVKVPPMSRPVASPKRLQLITASRAVRDEQDRSAVTGLTSHSTGPANGAYAVAAGGKSAAAAAANGGRVLATNQTVLTDGIYSVNNHFDTSPHLTPGGKVGIWGMGFGSPGAVTLVGGVFDKSPIKLQVVRWTNDTIEATVPGGLRGVPDVDGATLQVSTWAGKSYRFPNVSFVAAREEQTITDPQKMLMFVQGITSSSPWKGSGQIGEMRSVGSKSIDCPAIGTDTIHFQPVRGFEAIGATMVHGRTDSGDGDLDGWPGSRVFSGTYGFGDWVNEDLQVRWGVFRSHTSPRTYISFDGTMWSDPFYGSFSAAVFVGSPPIGAAE